MRRIVSTVFGSQQFGLIVVILVLGFILSILAGNHTNGMTGVTSNNFLNSGTIGLVILYACAFAIMAVGVTMVIITTGIDLSVGSTYALSGVLTALFLKAHHLNGTQALLIGAALCCTIGLVCGLLNGVLITTLGVHPFIITLGTMWVFRGIAFVVSQGNSILLPTGVVTSIKNTFGIWDDVFPVPIMVMVSIAVLGWLVLTKTVVGRRIFAVGGNLEASRYSGVRINTILILVYGISGLCAGIAAYLMAGYFGSTQSADGQGYELYVIASAVVGGASLAGGKGSAISAMLGALLISLIQQAIRTLKIQQEYEMIIIGCAIVIAVVLDRVSARLGAKRIAQLRIQ
jgi:ribose transport system permease protein